MHANMAVVVGHTTTYGYAEKKVRSFLSLPLLCWLAVFFSLIFTLLFGIPGA